MQPNYPTNQNNPITRFNLTPRKIVIGGAVAIIVILGLVSLLRQTNGSRRASAPFATNLAFAHQKDDNTVYYFSGSAFISYSLNSKHTSPLTPLYSLPSSVSEVVWSDDAALIHAVGYSPVDQLYPTLLTQKLNPNSYYWWLVDFKTGKISLVGDVSTGADVRGAAWQSNDSFVYSQTTALNSSKLNVFKSNKSLQANKIGELTDSDLIKGATASSIVYLHQSGQTQSLMALPVPSGQAATLADKVITVLSVAPDGSTLYIGEPKKAANTQSEEPRGPLMLAAAGKKTKTILDDFRGSASWYNGSTDWVGVGYNGTADPVGFSSQNGKLTQFSVLPPAKKDNNDDTHYTTFGQSADGLLILDTLNQLRFLSGKTVSDLPLMPDYGRIRNDDPQDAFSIVYVQDQDQYSIYIQQNPYQANIQKVLTYLQGLGYDPYQLKIKWYAYDNVDTGFRVPADALPVQDLDTDAIVPDLEDAGD